MDELLIEPEPTERELGTAPIKPLFARYAAITFAGMLAQMVMVVLEGLIIGNGLGPLGLAAVTVILPLELLNLALGGALGMGTAAAAGQRLGSGDTAGAQKVFNQGFWLAAYLLVALSAVIALFAPQIATLLGATPDIHEDVTAFIRLLMCFYPFCTLGQLLCSLLRTDEKPSLASALAVIASVLALFWLYLCVYVLDLGFAAAGAYYGMSTGLWFFAILYFQFNKKSTFKVTFGGMKLDPAICRTILWQGLPLFLVQVASLVYTIVINNYLGSLGGDPDLAAFSVINGYVVYLLDMLCLRHLRPAAYRQLQPRRAPLRAPARAGEGQPGRDVRHPGRRVRAGHRVRRAHLDVLHRRRPPADRADRLALPAAAGVRAVRVPGAGGLGVLPGRGTGAHLHSAGRLPLPAVRHPHDRGAGGRRGPDRRLVVAAPRRSHGRLPDRGAGRAGMREAEAGGGNANKTRPRIRTAARSGVRTSHDAGVVLPSAPASYTMSSTS